MNFLKYFLGLVILMAILFFGLITINYFLAGDYGGSPIGTQEEPMERLPGYKEAVKNSKILKENNLTNFYDVINGKIIVAGPYRVAELDEKSSILTTLMEAKAGEIFGLVDVYGGNLFESSVSHLIEYKYNPNSQIDLKQIQVIVYSVDDNKRPEGECDPETTCPKILYKKVIEIK